MNNTEDFNNKPQNKSNDLKVNKSTLILTIVLVAIVIIGIIVGMHMHAESEKKDIELQMYHEQQDAIENFSNSLFGDN